jgi:hypothetical protein
VESIGYPYKANQGIIGEIKEKAPLPTNHGCEKREGTAKTLGYSTH